jgi:DsbC/DsbD-like thiol-disulfide interchange protein
MVFRAALLLAFFLSALPVAAQPDKAVSNWSSASHSEVRLIAGGRGADGAYRVGVEIRMKAGFKTYWRVPGDAGVPPVFDWSGSDNLGSVAIRWPAPKRFTDGGVTTIGYKDRVIFPAIIRAADMAKTVKATLKLDYAVCDNICIPAKADVSLSLPEQSETSQTATLDQFRAQTPRAKEPGKLDDRPALISAAFIPEKGRKAVDVVLGIPSGGAIDDAFLEGPEGWLFGTPVVTQVEADKISMRIPIEDRPKNMVGLVPVVLTITGAPTSSEIRFEIEAVAAKP